MSFLDIILGLLLIWGLWKGLKNGLFVEIASLVALIAGIYGTIHFSYITRDYLSTKMDWNENYIHIAAFIITFILIVLVVQLAGRFLTKIVDFAMLGLLNKILGGLFGMLKVAVIIGALLIFFENVNDKINLVDDDTKNESVLYRPIYQIGAFIFDAVLRSSDEEVAILQK
ncbi:CvpA family protein [Maribacter sp. 2210JD10-5]|uniref:CvpA family protein n=1 Tax=Maribacter sp. 2210JD10-5 TaxID=3386272 RepID=UPI0039BCBE31